MEPKQSANDTNTRSISFLGASTENEIGKATKMDSGIRRHNSEDLLPQIQALKYIYFAVRARATPWHVSKKKKEEDKGLSRGS